MIEESEMQRVLQTYMISVKNVRYARQAKLTQSMSKKSLEDIVALLRFAEHEFVDTAEGQLPLVDAKKAYGNNLHAMYKTERPKISRKIKAEIDIAQSQYEANRTALTSYMVEGEESTFIEVLAQHLDAEQELRNSLTREVDRQKYVDRENKIIDFLSKYETRKN